MATITFNSRIAGEILQGVSEVVVPDVPAGLYVAHDSLPISCKPVFDSLLEIPDTAQSTLVRGAHDELCRFAKYRLGLDALVDDWDANVRAAVARQGFGLDKLRDDDDETVRIAVARQGRDVDLDKLAYDSSERVLFEVCIRGNFRQCVQVARNPYAKGSKKIQRHLLARGVAFDTLVESSFSDIREEVSQALAESGFSSIDEWVKENPDAAARVGEEKVEFLSISDFGKEVVKEKPVVETMAPTQVEAPVQSEKAVVSEVHEEAKPDAPSMNMGLNVSDFALDMLKKSFISDKKKAAKDVSKEKPVVDENPSVDEPVREAVDAPAKAEQEQADDGSKRLAYTDKIGKRRLLDLFVGNYTSDPRCLAISTSSQGVQLQPITVNFGSDIGDDITMPVGGAFINEVELPGIGETLERAGLAKPYTRFGEPVVAVVETAVGEEAYPLYKFDMEALSEYDAKGVNIYDRTYLQAHAKAVGSNG